MVLKARCLKPCPFKYGTCETGIISVHPRFRNRPDLLVDENGFLICHKGNFLTIYDKICDNCGEDLEFERESSIDTLAVYVCPNCNKKIQMDIIE